MGVASPVPVGARWENWTPDGLVGEKYTIGGEEEVEVPAGKFRAVRLDRSGGVQVWIAPGVGTLKWGEGKTPSAVLTTFQRGAGR